jgi:hypothetical protein
LEIIASKKVEVLFVLDNTSSMQREINLVKDHVEGISDYLISLQDDGSSVKFGLMTVTDIDTVSGCLLYEKLNDFTTDPIVIKTKLNNITTCGGPTYQEGYSSGLRVASNSKEFSWSTDALKLIIFIGDDLPRDNDVTEGIQNPSLSKSESDTDQSTEPDWQETLWLLKSNDIKLLAISSSEEKEYWELWRTWASWTGGSFVRIESDGRIPNNLNLNELILNLLLLLPQTK